MTEYCAVIGTHSTVRGDKLLYGQIPDPFPRCGIGSGHARLVTYMSPVEAFGDQFLDMNSELINVGHYY